MKICNGMGNSLAVGLKNIKSLTSIRSAVSGSVIWNEHEIAVDRFRPFFLICFQLEGFIRTDKGPPIHPIQQISCPLHK